MTAGCRPVRMPRCRSTLLTASTAMVLLAAAAPAALAGPAAPAGTPVGCSATDLAAALAGAGSGAVLDLAGECFYKLTAGLSVPVSLTINGDHATIQPAPSAPAMSMLTMASAADVSINHLTMIRGNGGAPDLGSGAAIKQAGTGTLTLSEANFTGNRAVKAGGAIYSGGPVTLTNCRFSNNSVEISGGGAIDAASVTADHSLFEDNNAGSRGGLGGAIAAGRLSVDSVSFHNNGRYGSGAGGAIFVTGRADEDTVTSSVFYGNKAQTGGAIGAALRSLTLTSTQFLDNEASEGGGAVAMSPVTAGTGNLVLEAGQFFENRTGGLGGAVLGSGHSTDVYRTNFHGNVAQSGGAIAQTAGTLTMLDADVNSNVADKLGGGGIRVGSGATAMLTATSLFVNRSFQIDGVSPYPVAGGGLLNLGTTTITGGTVFGNDPDNCAGSGTTTGC